MNEPLDILMLLDNPLRSDNRVEKEATRFIQAGYSVAIACESADDLDSEETRNGYTIHRLYGDFFKHPLRAGYRDARDAAVDRLLNFEFKVVHCHDIYMLMIGAEIKRRRPSVTLVYDAHEYYRGWPLYKNIGTFIGRIKGWLVWRYLLRQEHLLIRQAQLVLCTTPAIALKMKTEHDLSSLPLAVLNVPNPASTEEEKMNLKADLGLEASDMLMVQSGNIYQANRELEQLFELVTDIPRLHLVLIGDNARWNEVRKHYSVKYAKVHFVTYDAKRLHAMLKSCDFGLLYVQTHLHEAHYLGSPNRIMEYTVNALPYISVDHGLSHSLAAMFGHVVFYEIHDHVSLRKAVSEVFERYDELKQKAIQAAKAMSWDAEMQPVLDAYGAILGRLNTQKGQA